MYRYFKNLSTIIHDHDDAVVDSDADDDDNTYIMPTTFN